MAIQRDDFNRPNQVGLAGGPITWDTTGTWEIRDGAADSRVANSYATAVFNVDGRVKVPTSDAVNVVVRYIDANNHIRARLQRVTQTAYYTVTEYQYQVQWINPAHLAAHANAGLDDTFSVYTTSPTPAADTTMNHGHMINGVWSTHSHTVRQTGPLSSRQATRSYQYPMHRMFLEKVVGGSVTQIRTKDHNPHYGGDASFGVEAIGTKISLLYNNAVQISEDVNEHRTSNRWGFSTAPGSFLVLNFYEIDLLNEPPSPPVQVGPRGDQVINRSQDLILDWAFYDPDPTDQQSAYEVRWRRTDVTPLPAWTSVARSSTRTDHTIVGGTLVAGKYEWQVLVKDRAGVSSVWSPSEFFTAGDKPAGPTITSTVADGGTIPTSSYTERWSYANQEAFEWRTVADNAGLPDPTVIYAAGQGGAVQREALVPYPENDRSEHWQIRVQEGGLWSDWISRRRVVSYTQVAAATVRIQPDTTLGLMVVSVINPTPQGTQPNAVSNTLYRREIDIMGEPLPEIRLRDPADPMAGPLVLQPNATYLDPVPAEIEFQYRVDTLGDNDTVRIGAWFS